MRQLVCFVSPLSYFTLLLINLFLHQQIAKGEAVGIHRNPGAVREITHEHEKFYMKLS